MLVKDGVVVALRITGYCVEVTDVAVAPLMNPDETMTTMPFDHVVVDVTEGSYWYVSITCSVNQPSPSSPIGLDS
jgi:hypothetical protein